MTVSALGVVSFGNGVDKALGATAQHGFANGHGLLGRGGRFGFPHGMALVALALGGFLLRYSHCRRVSAKQRSSLVKSPLVKSLGFRER